MRYRNLLIISILVNITLFSCVQSSNIKKQIKGQYELVTEINDLDGMKILFEFVNNERLIIKIANDKYSESVLGTYIITPGIIDYKYVNWGQEYIVKAAITIEGNSMKLTSMIGNIIPWYSGRVPELEFLKKQKK